MINKTLSKGEKRPFFKDVTIHTSDLMSQFTMETKKEYLEKMK
jgi:hypothetical protein